MSIGNSIRSGVKWLLLGNLGGQVLQFVFGVVLARLLVPADFGLLVTVQIFTGLVGLVSSGGMGEALVQAKEANERDFDAVFTVQLLIGVAIYASFFLAAPFISAAFDNPLYQDLVRVSAVSFLLRPFLNTRANWLHREMQFKAKSLIALAASVFTGLASIAMAMVGMGVWSLVLSGILGTLVTLLLLDRASRRRPRLILDMSTTRKFGAYGLKVSLNDIVTYAKRQASNAIISRVAGPTLVGLYNKGESLAWLPLSTVSASVYEAVFRAMAKVQDNPDQVKYLFFRMITLMVAYTLPIYIGLAWMAEPLILFVFGKGWLHSAEPLRILSLAGLLICIGHPCGAVLAAMNRLGREVWVHIGHTIVVALACYFGLKTWGIGGAAWGVFAGLAFSTPIMYYLATQCVPATLGDLHRALAPGLKLNLILIAMLVTLHMSLPSGFRQTHPALYLIVAGGGAALAYVAAFLIIPGEALSVESQRWRTLLHMPR